jgi:hypothetical protein
MINNKKHKKEVAPLSIAVQDEGDKNMGKAYSYSTY